MVSERMPAQVDGFDCEVLNTDDEITRSVVEHKLIGYDGAALEDCGVDGRTYSFETMWANENYPNHKDFLENYRTKQAFNTVFHPVYGLLTGKIKRIRAVHNPEETDCVNITVEFTEEGMSSVEISRGDFNSIAEVGQACADEIVGKTSQSIFGAGRERTDRLSAAIHQMESRINLSVSIMNDYVKALTFPLSIPGRIAQNAFLICAGLQNAGREIINSPKNGLIAFTEQVRAIGRLFGRTDSAIEEAIIEAGAFTAAFTAEEVFNGIASAPIGERRSASGSEPSRRDIEDMVNTVRQSVSEIYDAPNALKEAVLIAAEAGRTALSRMGGERIVEIESETNIYSILMGARVDRAKAFDVCLRNDIENPNRVVGVIYLPQEDF
jgi:hypothetical protein